MAIDPNNLAGTATLTFSDEFNGQTLDTAKWGTGYPWGAANGSTNAANNEAQWYINADYAPTANLGTYTVGNGVLDIEQAPADAATQSLINGYEYTSGMVNTDKSFSQTYGYFEMRADIPEAPGMWPAFWLLPTGGGWPPELDVMEVFGYAPDSLVTSVHWDENGHQLVNKDTDVPGLSSGGMHTYGVDWQPDTITWYLDGQEVFEAPTPADMHQPMYMLANLAAGGEWAGPPDGSTNNMLIDYIRAYSEMPGGGTPPPSDGATTVSEPAATTGTTTGSSATVPATDPAQTPAPSEPATQPASVPAPSEPAAPTTPGDVAATAEPAQTVTPPAEAPSTGTVAETGGQVSEGQASEGQASGGQASEGQVSGAGGGSVDPVSTTPSDATRPDSAANPDVNGGGTQAGTGETEDNGVVVSARHGGCRSGGDGDHSPGAHHASWATAGGEGADSFRFDGLPWQAGRDGGFQHGTDTLDLRSLLANAGNAGSELLSGHHLTMTPNDAGGTDIAFDAGSGPVPLATIDHALSSQFHHGDWMFA